MRLIVNLRIVAKMCKSGKPVFITEGLANPGGFFHRQSAFPPPLHVPLKGVYPVVTLEIQADSGEACSRPMFAVEHDLPFFLERKQLQARAYGVEGYMDRTRDVVGCVLSLGADIDDQRCRTFQEPFLQIRPDDCRGTSAKKGQGGEQ